MRADRLVAILLLLQRRGRVTAAEVAEELEVSERTARRDLEALGMAGIPVYPRRGRNGGWELAGGGRTDLSGLTAAEARALFLVAGPSSTATPAVKAALRKLVRALPEPLRDQAEAAASAVVVDRPGWDSDEPGRPPPPFLDALEHAVVAGERVRLAYVDRAGTATERPVDPLGLAAKGHVWYLVAQTAAGRRTFRVDRVRGVAPTGERVRRPEGFDLAEAWREIRSEIDERRTPFRASARATERVAWICRALLGTRVELGTPAPDGRVQLALRGHSCRALAAEIAGLVPGLEVTDPPELRAELARIGAALVAAYG